MKRIPSIFNEALAPVTPGPSSSNTAGPMRIASVCRQFFGLPITKASIEMSKHGSFPFTYFGMRSDLAFVFGLLSQPVRSRLLRRVRRGEGKGRRHRLRLL